MTEKLCTRAVGKDRQGSHLNTCLGLTDPGRQWLVWLPKGRTRVGLMPRISVSHVLCGIQIDDLDIGKCLVLTVGGFLMQHLLDASLLPDDLPANWPFLLPN